VTHHPLQHPAHPLVEIDGRAAECYAMLRSDAPKTPVTGIMYL
jgi:hypothetical protein